MTAPALTSMKLSDRGLSLIKEFEGLELEAYQDIAGIWTIGYGHTEKVTPGQVISQVQANDLLRQDIAPREYAVRDLVTVPLNQNEFDALVSFVFNVGVSAFGGSTALKRLNKEDRQGAAEALTWWNKATVDGVLRPVNGLTRRRAAEKALFLKAAPKHSANETSNNPAAQDFDVEEVTNSSLIEEAKPLAWFVVAAFLTFIAYGWFKSVRFKGAQSGVIIFLFCLISVCLCGLAIIFT